MGLLEIPDLRHTLVGIGTTLLCISGYNWLPGRTLPIIFNTRDCPTVRKGGLCSFAKCCFIRNTRSNDGKDPFLHVLEIASKILRQASKDSEGVP